MKHVAYSDLKYSIRILNNVTTPTASRFLNFPAAFRWVARRMSASRISLRLVVGAGKLLPIRLLGAGGGGRIFGIRFGNNPGFHLKTLRGLADRSSCITLRHRNPKSTIRCTRSFHRNHVLRISKW